MAKPPTLTELSDAERERAAELRTLRAWVAHYRQNGLAGLARQPRADREAPQRVTPDLAKLMEAFAEFERALIRERQRDGIAPVKQRGVYRGMKEAHSAVQRAELRQRLAAGEQAAAVGDAVREAGGELRGDGDARRHHGVSVTLQTR